MEEQFHAVPGMVKVGLSTYTPMEADEEDFGVQIQGQPWLNKGASFVKANAEYFDAVGTHVVMGRGIDVRDTSTAPLVGVANQAFVKRSSSRVRTRLDIASDRLGRTHPATGRLSVWWRTRPIPA
jgi:macrolide transport system ATP-binding/permease protein